MGKGCCKHDSYFLLLTECLWHAQPYQLRFRGQHAQFYEVLKISTTEYW